MENSSETITLSNNHSDMCNDSKSTDQKLKHEITQMISNCNKKDKKHKKNTTSSNTDSSSCDESIDNKFIKAKHTKHAKYTTTSSCTSNDDWKNSKHVNNDNKLSKISQVTKDTRNDVLKILLILQKLIDDSRSQKQKTAKLELKIKELEEKIENNSCSNSTYKLTSDSSDKKYCHNYNIKDYEINLDKFKQEVNAEIIKINNMLLQLNTNFDDQITSVREQIATLFSMPKNKGGNRCC